MCLLYKWLVYRLSQYIHFVGRDFLTAYNWSSKGDGVDLLCKVINSDVVTGRWRFTVATTADTIMIGELRNSWMEGFDPKHC